MFGFFKYDLQSLVCYYSFFLKYLQISSKELSASLVSSIYSNQRKMTSATGQTPWRSIWIATCMQFICGVQISIYFMSMWPFLNGLDKTATMDFLGWVVASCSVGCVIANPLFGFWNQKTMSVRYPCAFGFCVSAIGQFMYALLPLFEEHVKWKMMIARFITGIGSGTLAVLRSYVATAAVPSDKLAAISYGTAGMVLGISFGPAIQAVFTPVDPGFMIGNYPINMYTLPPLLMVVLLLAAVTVMMFFFQEQYSGIIKKEELPKGQKLPMFDVLSAIACIWLWVTVQMTSTIVEVISTPISTVMYDWKDSKSIMLNGIFTSISCVISVGINFLIGSKLGNSDKRKLCLFGLSMFMVFNVCCFPWPFYPGPLNFIPSGKSSSEIGGCDGSFRWCEGEVRIPLYLYVFCVIIIYGIAFPFVSAPSSSLFSEILGPRPQGTMQGIHSSAGSFAQLLGPIVTTYLFQSTGYRYVFVLQMGIIGIGMGLILILYKRLIPLKVNSQIERQ